MDRQSLIEQYGTLAWDIEEGIEFLNWKRA